MSTGPVVVTGAALTEAERQLLADRVLGGAEPSMLMVRAVETILTARLSAERERIAAAIEEEGREDVQWLASVATDNVDRARHIGAEDAYKAAARLARNPHQGGPTDG